MDLNQIRNSLPVGDRRLTRRFHPKKGMTRSPRSLLLFHCDQEAGLAEDSGGVPKYPYI